MEVLRREWKVCCLLGVRSENITLRAGLSGNLGKLWGNEEMGCLSIILGIFSV